MADSISAGYQDAIYAKSLREFGAPYELSRAGGWVLKRPIAGTTFRDAMGCYPFFGCRDWSQLSTDLRDLEHELISIALVSDPFGTHSLSELRSCFPDVMIPFKEHFVVDLSQPIESFVASHHKRNARKALQFVEVEVCADPHQHLDEWTDLYAVLLERHNIRGLTRFSRASFAEQLRVPGLVMLRAVSQGETVGLTLWYTNDSGVSYYHLGAYSERGYELRASFALFWEALQYFTRQGLSWLNLGAGAGVTSDGQDGLSRFKRGWSTNTRTAYFCGRIFNQDRYAKLVKQKEATESHYFPAYRAGEFG